MYACSCLGYMGILCHLLYRFILNYVLKQIFIIYLCSLNSLNVKTMLLEQLLIRPFPTGMSPRFTLPYIQAATVGCHNVYVEYGRCHKCQCTTCMMRSRVVGVYKNYDSANWNATSKSYYGDKSLMNTYRCDKFV